MKYVITILAICIATVCLSQGKPKYIKKDPQAKPMAEQPVTKTDNPAKNMEGAWMFVSAKTSESDMSSKYVFGMMDGKPRKMILSSDGKIQYENEVIEKWGIKEASWNVEKNEENGNYYFKMSTSFNDGMSSNESEKIITADGQKLIFGKRMTVEYVRFKE